MPLTELTELVVLLDRANLEIPAESSAILRRVEALEELMERVGAASSAAQLGLAASLLERANGRTSEGNDVAQTVRTLVVAVEKAFHVGLPGKETRRERPAVKAPVREERRATPRMELRLHVARDMLLGEMLLHFGVVAPAEIETALELQRGTQKRLGEILIEHGFATQAEIELALDYQKRIRSAENAKREKERPAPADAPHTDPAAPTAPLPAYEKPPPKLRLATELLLGEILVLQGVVTRKELELALQQQRRSGLLLGEVLLSMGHVTRQQMQSALTVQGTSRRARRRQASG